MPELKSEFLFTIRVGVSRLHDIGNTPFGLRHIDILGAETLPDRGSRARCCPAAWTRRSSAPMAR